jgi:hypothetical protein
MNNIRIKKRMLNVVLRDICYLEYKIGDAMHCLNNKKDIKNILNRFIENHNFLDLDIRKKIDGVKEGYISFYNDENVYESADNVLECLIYIEL